MKEITALRAQKRREDRVNIYLDGEYAFSLQASLATRLKVGQLLSPEECERLEHEDAVHRGQEQALHFLAYRPRSRSEVERYLQGKEWPDEVIQHILAQLEEAGWLGDASFSRFWVDNREDFRPRSRRALQVELRQKGVSDQVIEQALQGIDERDSAYRAAWGRAQRLARFDRQTFYRRLGGFLQRRGFAYDIVKETVERLWRECTSHPSGARDGDVNFAPSSKDQI